MNPFTRIKRPPRASGREPSLVDPQAWNHLVDYCIQIEDVIRRVLPKSSPDILANYSPGGVSYALTRRGRASASCPLTPFLINDPEFGVSITHGLSADTVPTIGGNPLADDEYLAIPGNEKLWLVVEWQPASEYQDGVYFIVGGGTHISSDFQVSETRPAETQAEIDPSTGAATNGIYAFCWAVFDVSAPPGRISAKRCGNHYFTFCPGSLRLVFD